MVGVSYFRISALAEFCETLGGGGGEPDLEIVRCCCSNVNVTVYINLLAPEFDI
jgi:hypothetical protein